ncbi:MAG TPA: hypothetical protein VGN17_02125 [Bryobacteraceae bacterium]|jgi:hypothetical protein
MSPSQPVAKLNLFPVTAAIWVNQSGENSWYSATIDRLYKDDAGSWKSTNTFRADDLLLVAKIADWAHTEIVKLKTESRD